MCGAARLLRFSGTLAEAPDGGRHRPAAEALRRRYTRTVNVIVLPTYNERENLRDAIARIREVADGDGVQLHTLIVDDNSPDGTGDLADELAREVPDVSVLHRGGKAGLGKAYVAGFRKALDMGAERIFEMDADLSHDASYLPHFLRLIDQGADLVLGSRYVKGGGVENWTLPRKIISRGGCLYAQTILGLPLHDLTGGYKCFRRRVLETIDLDAIDTKGYGFQIEMTYRAYKLGFKVAELPIIFVDRKVGESKMSNDIVVEAMKNVWKLRFSHVPTQPAS
jgi:dolichol-phosphate mannosyltransferase